MGSLVSTRRIIVSSSNHSRLEAASEYLETLLGHSEVLALAPTRGATDDFVRGVSDRKGGGDSAPSRPPALESEIVI